MIRAFLIIAFAATALLVASEGKTKNALTADILMGRWCGDVSAYTFTRDKLTSRSLAIDRKAFCVSRLSKLRTTPSRWSGTRGMEIQRILPSSLTQAWCSRQLRAVT
jgi:hypothetical protein